MSRPRSLDTRQKILEIAEKDFAQYGYAGAHLQGIAEQVGVQKTALYYYFPSKSALYTAVLQTMLEAFRDTVNKGVREEGTGQERLEFLLGELNDLLAEHPSYAKILFRIFVDSAPFDGAVGYPVVEEIVGTLLRFYRDGVERGEFRNLSSRHFFMSIVGTVFFHYAAANGFANAVLGVDDVFTRSVVAWRRQELRDFVAHGVLADKPDTEGD